MSVNTQPRGLSVFFLSEMWERYGFYTVQGLLALFLSKMLGFNDSASYAIAGSFTALSYIAPIFGGYIADAALGYRHSVIFGGILLCIGYASLATSHSSLHFFISLSIITMGTGLFKPSVSSLLGTLYTPHDARRDAGYTLFYVGISVGIILSTSLSGYIVQYYGWSQSFFTAAVVIAIGTMTFAFGTQHFNIYDRRPITHTLFKTLSAYAITALLIMMGTFILRNTDLALVVFTLVLVTVLGVLIYHAYHEVGHQRRKIIAYLLLVLISIMFWAIYFQLFMSLNLFIDRAVDHNLLGYHIPTVAFIGMEALGIIVFGPILSKIWTHLHRKGCGPSLPGKFTLGVLFACLSFVTLIIGIKVSGSDQLVHPFWVILSYLVLAIGELSLSPIGLAMVTELSPPRLIGMMMGIFFVSLGLGGKLAGVLADYAAINKTLDDVQTIKTVYAHAFSLYAIIALVATIICLLLLPLIKRLVKP